MNQKLNNQILEGNIATAAILFALPIALSSVLQQLFNAADQAVVGRFAGSLALAAVGANTPVVSLLVNVFSAVSIGSNALIARKIGENKRETINRIVHTSITFAGIAGICLMCIGMLVAGPLLTLIGTPENVLDMAVVYLRIYALGFPFSLLFNFGAAILRSVGDTRRPMIALSLAGVLNVILNLVFVIGLGMGVSGVACATSISNLASATTVLIFLRKQEGELHFDPRKLGIDSDCLRQVLQIGAPAGLQSAVFSVANVCIQSGINSLGSDAIAGSVAANNFDYFSYFICSAFSQTATTFCGQNYGARQMDRCKKVLRTVMLESMCFTFAFDMICILNRHFFISFFTTDPAVAEYAYQRILLVVGPHCMICLYEVLGAAIRSMGESLAPALLTILGCVAFRVAWLLTVFRLFGSFTSLMIVYPASWVVTAALMWGYYLRKRNRIYAL